MAKFFYSMIVFNYNCLEICHNERHTLSRMPIYDRITGILHNKENKAVNR